MCVQAGGQVHAVLGSPRAPAYTDRMGHWTTLDTPHGRIAAWQADPAGAPRGALVVVQEIFGVNAHIRSVAEGFALEGYAVLAPACFDVVEPGVELAYDAGGVERGRALKAAVGLERANDITHAAANALAASHHRVGTVGYCWGGTVALLAAQQWRGNIRELRNVLEQAALRADSDRLDAGQMESLLRQSGLAQIQPALPPEPAPPDASALLRPLAEQVAELEQRAIAAAMQTTGGNKLAAARLLGISRATLYERLDARQPRAA